MAPPRLNVLPLLAPPDNIGWGEYFPEAGYQFLLDDTWDVTRDWVGVAAHHASDLIAMRGVLIVAAASGSVSFSGWDGYGASGWNMGVVSHDSAGQEYRFHYAHMMLPPAVKAGEHVEVGQFLGIVGNSGGTAGAKKYAMDAGPPHLHFGMYGPGGPGAFSAWNPYSQIIAMAPQVSDRWFSMLVHPPERVIAVTQAATHYLTTISEADLAGGDRLLYGKEALDWNKIMSGRGPNNMHERRHAKEKVR